MGVNGNNAREDFLEKYKANIHEIGNNKVIKLDNYLEPGERMPTGEINAVIEEMTRTMERDRRKKHESTRKRQIRKAKNARRAKLKGHVKRTVTALFLAGVAIVGGHQAKNAYDTYQQQNASITLEQALENGETLNSLGIDSNILSEIQDIKKILENENLTEQEVMALAPRMRSIYMDTVKSKLANTLGVEQDDIHLHITPGEEGTTRESVEVDNGKTYVSKDFLTYKASISKEISDATQGIDEAGSMKLDIEQGNFNIDDTIKQYRTMIKDINEFAAGKMEVDENENITIEKTKVSDLDKQSDDLQTADLAQEKDMGEER